MIIASEFNMCYNESNKLNEKITRKNFGDLFKENSLKLGLDILSDMIPGTNTIFKAIKKISGIYFQ